MARPRGPTMPRIAMIIAAPALLGTPAAAQEWPARPLTMVVPFAAGGEADVVGRIVGTGVARARRPGQAGGDRQHIRWRWHDRRGPRRQGGARRLHRSPSPLAQRFIEQARAVTTLMPQLP